MEHFCANHPDRPTRKRCYQCKKYICVECQIFFMQRPFCSVRCLLTSLWRSFVGLFITVESSGKKRIRWPQYLSENSVRLVFYSLLIFMLFFVLLSIKSLTRELRLLREAQQTPHQVTITPSPAIPEEDSLFAKPDAMVMSNKINIHGEAARNTVISLKINDELVAVTLPENEKFAFEDIELKYGNNEIVIQGIDEHGRIKTLEKLTTFFGSPRINYLARNITRGDQSRPQIALTFDGGAGNSATNHILDYLKEKNVKCTMFLTGQFIKRFPEETRRIVREGHEVGNHTWSHPHLTTFTENRKHQTNKGVTGELVQEELNKTAALFKRTTGVDMLKYWRAPYGEHNLQVRRWAAELGYSQIGWTIGKGENLDTFDWVADTSATVYKTSDDILSKVLNFGSSNGDNANGGIILMHLDTQRTQDPVYKIIPALIDSFRTRGYEFVTISEMFKGR